MFDDEASAFYNEISITLKSQWCRVVLPRSDLRRKLSSPVCLLWEFCTPSRSLRH